MNGQQTRAAIDIASGKPDSKRRLLAIALLTVLITSAGVYRYRSALMQWGLERLVEDMPISTVTFSGTKFGWANAEVANMQFQLQTDTLSLSAHLQGIKAGYDLNTATLGAVGIANARLRFSYKPEGRNNRDSDVLLPMPLLPCQSLTVEALNIEIETPFGNSVFAGHADLVRSKGGGLVAAFRSSDESLRLDLSHDARSALAEIAQGDGRKIAQLNYKQTDRVHSEADLAADANALLNWLSTSSVTPSNIRTALRTSVPAVASTTLDAIDLNVHAVSDDGLQNLKGRILATGKQNYIASAEVEFHIPNHRINVDGHLDMTVSELLEVLKPWLPAQVGVWQSSSGQAIGTFRVTWQAQTNPSAEVYLRAYHVAGAIGHVQVEEGYIRGDLTNIAPYAGVVQIEVPTIRLGKETKVHNLQLKAEFENDQLTIEQASLPLFGGELNIAPSSLDLAQSPLNLTLGVDKLDLSQLLDSLNYPDLSGTGTISGKLPLRLAADSIEVRDGVLNGMRPGVLRYRGAFADQDNIAFKALRNLRYHSLQGKLNYQPDGGYILGLRLEGKNPEVFSGHSVAFNLNLSGRLPELLQKGILAGDFDKPILEQLNSTGKQ